MLKAVIFDFDGVIADSFNAVYEIQIKTARHFGKTPKYKNHEEYRELFSTDWRKFYTEVLGIHECLCGLKPAVSIFEEAI